MEIRVKVTPGARKERVEEEREGVYLVSVKEEAEGNKANIRVRTLFSELYGVSLSKVRILSGHKKGNKIIRIAY